MHQRFAHLHDCSTKQRGNGAAQVGQEGRGGRCVSASIDTQIADGLTNYPLIRCSRCLSPWYIFPTTALTHHAMVIALLPDGHELLVGRFSFDDDGTLVEYETREIEYAHPNISNVRRVLARRNRANQ